VWNQSLRESAPRRSSQAAAAARSFKKRIRSRLTSSPVIGRIVTLVWTPLLYLRVKWRSRAHRRQGYDRFLYPLRTLYVSPADLQFSGGLPDYCKLPAVNGFGQVLGGDWDDTRYALEKEPFYRALREVVEDGVPWSETWPYRGAPIDAKTHKEIRFFEQLYESVREHGYLSRTEMRFRDLPGTDKCGVDEVSVSIDRQGEFLFCDGRHRLAVAKLLGVERIPVQVGVRHSEWMAFRRLVQDYAEKHDGRVPQPIPHADLDNVPARLASDEVFGMIRHAMRSRPGASVLDLGASWGYFCHRLEELGYDCCAAEGSQEDLYFLRRLHRAGNRRFEIVEECVPDGDDLGERRFNAILVVNGAADDGDPEVASRLERLLESQQPDEVFVATANDRGGPDAAPAAQGVVTRLAQSGLKYCTMLGTARDGSRLYRLTATLCIVLGVILAASVVAYTPPWDVVEDTAEVLATHWRHPGEIVEHVLEAVGSAHL
jgi:hypothetical protein